MTNRTTYKIAVLPGDGIGSEVIREGIKALRAVETRLEGVRFDLEEYSVGAGEYLRSGDPLPPATLERVKRQHAILLGAHPPVSQCPYTPQEPWSRSNRLPHRSRKHRRVVRRSAAKTSQGRDRSHRCDANHSERLGTSVPCGVSRSGSATRPSSSGGQGKRAAVDGVLPPHF